MNLFKHSKSFYNIFTQFTVLDIAQLKKGMAGGIMGTQIDIGVIFCSGFYPLPKMKRNGLEEHKYGSVGELIRVNVFENVRWSD